MEKNQTVVVKDGLYLYYSPVHQTLDYTETPQLKK
jgi:hypothetical protein